MIYKLKSDRLGNLFIATVLQGFSIYEGAGIEWLLAEDGFMEYQPSSLSGDSHGNLWYGSRGGGLRRLNRDGLVQFTTAHGLPENNILCIDDDTSGTIRFSYESPGFSSYDGEYLKTYTTAQGLPGSTITCILQDSRDRTWLGSYSGLTCIDSLSSTTYSLQQGLGDSVVTKVIESQSGAIWCATGNGVACVMGTSIISLTTAQGLSENLILDIAEDKEGNIWLATYEGLNLLRKETIISLLSNESISLKKKLFETFYINDGLPDNVISKIEVDKGGDIIVGTINGIAVLSRGSRSFEEEGGLEVYNAQNGYNIKEVLHLSTDTAGIIWISTGSRKTGLVRLDRQALIQDTFPPKVEIHQVKLHGRSLSWYDLLPRADSLLHLDSQYSAVYNTEELRAYTKILSDQERDSIRNIYSGVTFDSITRWNPVPIGLTIPYNHNNLTFEFHAIVLARNSAVRYQHMLEGYDTEWSPISEDATATFGNISEGKYTFKVKARSPDGVWGKPMSYSFTVLPPLHRSWWAYSLYSLALLSMIYAGQHYLKRRTIRAEQQKSKQKQAILNERLRISRDLHDEVGATLSGISMYSHIAKEQIKAQSQDGLFSSLNIMQESSGDMVKKLNDIIWLLNPEQARLQQLVEKLEEYIRQLAEYKNVSVSVDIIDHISAIELPLEVRRNIYLIFKEAINNSFKYSQAASISLTIKSAHSNLEFILQDDGVGFDMETVKRGNGLNNMQSRATEIGATLHLDSASGRGTRLLLKYALPF
jgi:signal transduction histidine kinase/ligand-binding sensor domain-containing protein